MGSNHSSTGNGAQQCLINPKGKSQNEKRDDKQSLSCDTHQAGKNEPPPIIKSLSNMTNKLVGEAKIMTNVLKDGGVRTSAAVCNDGKQHVPYALQLRIKGSKPTSNKNTSGYNEPLRKNKPNFPDGRMINANSNRSRSEDEDSIERRRRSLQNGDVFIYPRLYKDLNECRKCRRDNRICNCIELELSSDSSGSMEKVLNQPSSASILAHSPIEESYLIQKSESLQSLASDESGAGEEPVYKISITAASVNQGKDQLKLSAPKIIIPSEIPISAKTTSLLPEIQSNSLNGIKQNSKLNQSWMNDCESPTELREQQQKQQHSAMISSYPLVTKVESRTSTPENNLTNPTSISMSKSQDKPLAVGTWDSFSNINIRGSSSNTFEIYPERLGPRETDVPNLSPLRHSKTDIRSNNDQSKDNDLKIEPMISSTTPSDSPTRLPAIHLSHDENLLTPCSEVVPDSLALQNSLKELGYNNEACIPMTFSNTLINDIDNLAVTNSISRATNFSMSPIQVRRKNMVNKLSRKAIYEDSEFPDSDVPTFEEPPQRGLVMSKPIPITELLSPDDSLTGVLDYSPILTSVRDYIKNMNTELQVQTSTASQSGFNDDTSALKATSVVCSSMNTDTALVVSSPMIPSSIAQTILDPIELTTTSNGIVQTSFTTTVPAASIKAHVGTVEVETPKKSIFDGASKDEILEYLEDARERVPELLMAADDVMVISENELIVVNQLEPDSPATPISLVETNEIAVESPVEIGLPVNPIESMLQLSINHQDQFRKRLEEMYQTATSSNSNFDNESRSPNDTLIGGYSATMHAPPSQSDIPAILSKLDEGDKLAPELISKIASDSMTSEASASLLEFTTSPIYVSRRNSASGSYSKSISRENALQMLALQKRCTNRNSLSSPLSSPPSSTSPSSSSSSNPTSGNCSATTSFYASSSLSCSSPLLALNANPTNNSASFNQPIPVADSNILYTNNYDCFEPSNSSYDTSYGPSRTPEAETQLKDPTASPEARSNVVSPHVDLDDSGIGNEPLNRMRKGSLIQNKLGIIEESRAQSSQNWPNSSKMQAVKYDGPGFPQKNKNLIPRTTHGHYNTLNRLNNYFMNRHPFSNSSDSKVEFQCLDCDQFIDVDQATIMNKTNELRLLRATDSKGMLDSLQTGSNDQATLTLKDLDRAYVAAMNGLPLCKLCEKKRIERKEIISEFVETELKYGRDLRIMHDEFYRPMQIAGLLSKDQIDGVFLDLEELMVAHRRFAERLETAIREAHSMGDTDYNTVNIGHIFVESSEMLHTFESYCIRQGSAACLLARLAKEKELLRIFLRVSQMENTLLRRMNLAAFLMVPVQRVTKYPLLLNRLYKVTAYHHKDREALRDAQLKVELHLEHINQQTKGTGASNKIWRRISSLSTPISNRRGLMNAEDIGYIKLRKTATDILKWNREDTQFIHSGKVQFASLNEYLTRQKMKSLRYMHAHALLIIQGRPNWKYRPDLVKSNLDSKLMTPTPGGNGIKEAALLLFREKNGRFVPCREPLFLSNCVLSNDCSQFNSECPLNQPNSQRQNTNQNNNGNRKLGSSSVESFKETNCHKLERQTVLTSSLSESIDIAPSQRSPGKDINELRTGSLTGDVAMISSIKGIIDDTQSGCAAHTSRSYSLASALPRTTITTNSANNLSKPISSNTSSNLTILNQLMIKVNNYHNKQTPSNSQGKTNATSNLDQSNKSCSISTNSSPSGSLDMNHDKRIEPLTTIRCKSANSADNNQLNNNHNYNYHYYHHHNHHQPYGDYEESFEIHERIGKETMLLRADTLLKTRYWLQMLRYHAKDLGQWRCRRNGLANIMMMRHE